jgi:predicted glycogen debranching enzyme
LGARGLDMKYKADNYTFSQLNSLEWLETNGLGAWAMGTLSGINTRKYHSWLVASYNPPTDRFNLVPKITESLSTDSEYHELDANQFGDAIHPKGWVYLDNFEKDLFPSWEFKTPLGTLKRSILMPNGKNLTLVKYKVKAKKATRFHLRLYHIFRDIHALYNQNDYKFEYEVLENELIIKESYSGKQVFIQSTAKVKINLDPEFFNNVSFTTEQARGYDFVENWMTAGFLDVELTNGENELFISLSTERINTKECTKLFDNEVDRRKKLLKKTESDFEKDLILAADQFIVNRKETKSIIAGYPWFTDWGRDTMISLNGLTLATKRFDDAYKILLSFKEVVHKGLIPNRFVEVGSTPEYNTIDATLWFVLAIYQYAKASKKSVAEFYPTLKNILTHHIEGTFYEIKMDTDALLNGGEEGWQLTWMDAKLDGVVVTPRRGKAVEINALWYNVLKIAEHFSTDYDFGFDCKGLASLCKKNFNKKFIKENGALYDVVNDDFSDGSIRPNQAFAGALPFKVISKETAESVINELEKHLLTPHGLRTLNPDNQEFKGCCNGDLHSRDYAYHQGTVWMWLWGAYADTLLYVDEEKGIKKIKKQLKEIEKHFYINGIASLSEVFDGDAPHEAGGCPAQAWSVAEVLRILKRVY